MSATVCGNKHRSPPRLLVCKFTRLRCAAAGAVAVVLAADVSSAASAVAAVDAAVVVAAVAVVVMAVAVVATRTADVTGKLQLRLSIACQTTTTCAENGAHCSKANSKNFGVAVP